MIRSAAVLLVLALSVAACGNDDGDIAAGGPVQTGPDQPVSTVGPGGPVDPGSSGPTVVEPRGDATDVHRIDWEELRPTDDDDDRTHLVTFWGGVEPCFVVDHVDVEETPDRVTITVFAGSAPEAEGRACIELAEHKAVEIVLDEPLADREVVDGAEHPDDRQ